MHTLAVLLFKTAEPTVPQQAASTQPFASRPHGGWDDSPISRGPSPSEAATPRLEVPPRGARLLGTLSAPRHMPAVASPPHRERSVPLRAAPGTEGLQPHPATSARPPRALGGKRSACARRCRGRAARGGAGRGSSRCRCRAPPGCGRCGRACGACWGAAPGEPWLQPRGCPR